MKEIVWANFDTYMGNAGKQHAFTYEIDERGIKRNKRLCFGFVTDEEDSPPTPFDEVKKHSTTQEPDCCKRCLAKIKKLSE